MSGREKAAAVAAEILQRDQRDRTRAASPLVPAEDAIVIDSTGLSIEDVEGAIEKVIRKKLSDVASG
jgi:cytidylate kinase